MKIAILAPFEERVPPPKYGGTERVVRNLVNELVAKGHDVTLYASGDSKTAAKLIPGTPRAVRKMPQAHNPKIRQSINLQALVNAVHHMSQQKYDIVHNNFGWETLWFKDMLTCPILTTLHFTDGNDFEKHMAHIHKNSPFISISRAQRKQNPGLNYIATIHNSVQLNRFPFSDKPDDYLLFLGRIHPHKAPDKAIKLAKRTGKRLIIAAKIDPFEDEYYKTKIKPLIDGKQIKFVGEVGHGQKVALLQKAQALLSPIQWDEPFGITNIEALACGTPVITMNRGSLPEIIVDGKVGFLCKDMNEMARRIGQFHKIDRRACREHAEKHFSAEDMARKYLDAYQSLITS